MNGGNLGAVLAVIRYSEGTANYQDPYGIVFGGGKFSDFSDHPAITGEWKGALYGGRLTTAAGAYQITKTTWLSLRSKIFLPDFTPASQDKAAGELIGEVGGVEALASGDFARCLFLIRNIWASLPGNNAGQPQKNSAELAKVYTDNGGAFA